MITLTLEKAAAMMHAGVTGEVGSVDQFPSVCTDSRSIQPGQCFIAIRGPRFDAHDFIPEVVSAGAAVLVTSDGQDRSNLRIPVLSVDDTTRALQKLAQGVRLAWNRPLVGVTGSMGKTTTRRFVAELLSQKFKVHQSAGNLNNEFGVPLTLLQLEDSHEAAVLELGMNHPGEIRLLASICRPTHAVITNVAPVHLEFFQNIDEIAAAKGEILEGLSARDCFIYNSDDARVVGLARHCPARKIPFGVAPEAEIRILEYRIHALDSMSFRLQLGGHELSGNLPFAGKHLLNNVAAAVAVAFSFGLSASEISAGLHSLSTSPMRGAVSRETTRQGGSYTILDETYNANPESVTCVLETVAGIRGSRRLLLALGDMLELGPESEEFHRRIGRLAARLSPTILVTVGCHSQALQEEAISCGLPAHRCFHFESSQTASVFLADEVREGDLLVCKGSRGVGMDQIVRALRHHPEELNA